MVVDRYRLRPAGPDAGCRPARLGVGAADGLYRTAVHREGAAVAAVAAADAGGAVSAIGLQDAAIDGDAAAAARVAAADARAVIASIGIDLAAVQGEAAAVLVFVAADARAVVRRRAGGRAGVEDAGGARLSPDGEAARDAAGEAGPDGVGHDQWDQVDALFRRQRCTVAEDEVHLPLDLHAAGDGDVRRHRVPAVGEGCGVGGHRDIAVPGQLRLFQGVVVLDGGADAADAAFRAAGGSDTEGLFPLQPRDRDLCIAVDVPVVFKIPSLERTLFSKAALIIDIVPVFTAVPLQVVFVIPAQGVGGAVGPPVVSLEGVFCAFCSGADESAGYIVAGADDPVFRRLGVASCDLDGIPRHAQDPADVHTAGHGAQVIAVLDGDACIADSGDAAGVFSAGLHRAGVATLPDHKLFILAIARDPAGVITLGRDRALIAALPHRARRPIPQGSQDTADIRLAFDRAGVNGAHDQIAFTLSHQAADLFPAADRSGVFAEVNGSILRHKAGNSTDVIVGTRDLALIEAG